MIGYYPFTDDKWNKYKFPNISTSEPIFRESMHPNRTEFEELKLEVMEIKEQLKKAIEYNKPTHEMEEKITLLKKIAELIGVDLKDIYNKGQV